HPYPKGAPDPAVRPENPAVLSCTSQITALLPDTARGKFAETAIAANSARSKSANSCSLAAARVRDRPAPSQFPRAQRGLLLQSCALGARECSSPARVLPRCRTPPPTSPPP